VRFSSYNLCGSTEEIRTDLGLRGRNAVVLGGTGIGRAIANTFAVQGADCFCARNAVRLRTLLPSCETKACGQPILRAVAAVHEATYGTNAKWRLHRAMSEFEGEAENICSY
jgi:NAD(P)-dependent dehydrogenase (short-subunit alcohol dehydrogenase family)